MNTFELIVALSKNRISNQERDEIEKYFSQGADWDLLIGQLMFHKLLCRAYKHFTVQGWVDLLPSAIKQPSQKLFNLNVYKNDLKKIHFKNLITSLNNQNIRYCVIKGLPLEKDLFGESVREFNDTDILIHIRDLELADNILTGLGYKRGLYNSILNTIETHRHLDIYSIMNTHQTIPYHKLLDDPLFKVDTIDLQFELAVQKKHNYSIDIDSMLENRICVDIDKTDCYALNMFDNFIMLCTHLYGEAILIDEIKNYKDLQLTKFADVYEWIEKYYQFFDWEEKINYINAHGFLKPVLFCIYILSKLYVPSNAKNILDKFGDQNFDFLDEYRDELFNIKKWKISVMDRMFKVYKFDLI